MKKRIFFLLLVVLGLCSCKKDTNSFPYLAVQLVDSEWWSIVDTKTGEIIVRDEYKHAPSMIVDGMYIVANDANTGYDVFNISEPKKTVNNESYKDITTFSENGLTFAVKEGEGICLIDKNCKVVAELDNNIRYCWEFSEGLAMFKDSKDKYGFIDENGKVVIKAKYDKSSYFHDGVAVVTNFDDDNEVKNWEVIDKKGNSLLTISKSSFDDVSYYSEGVMAVEKDGNMFFINKKGEKVGGKFGVDDYCYVMKNGKTIFNDGNAYGLKSKDGEILIRAKYDNLVSYGKYFLAEKNDKYGLIDEKDQVILDFEYEDGVFELGDDVFLVVNNDIGSLINKEGKDICKESFEDCSLRTWNSVKSNFFDAVSVVKNVIENFNESSCFGITSGTTLSSFKRLLTSSASSYTYRDNLSEWKNGVGFVNYTFNSYLASQQWTTEYYYGYSYRVPNGYAFNYSSTCNRIIFSIDVDEYSAKSEEKFVEEFERQLKNGGYTSVDNNFWKSSAGNYVSAGYNEGTIFVHYSFVEPTYSLKRIKRGKESEEVAEVAEEVVEEGVEEVVEVVAE